MSRDPAPGPDADTDRGTDRGADFGTDPAKAPVFLERQTYRRRRLADAARLMPFLGGAVFAVPLLWQVGGTGEMTTPVLTSGAAIYLFLAWAGLIVLSAWLGRFLQGWAGVEGGGDLAAGDTRGADRRGG